MQTSPVSLMSKVAVCELLSVSDRTLEKLVKGRKFPPPLRLGKEVRWAEDVVSGWLEQQLREQRTWVPASPRRRPATSAA